MGHNFSQIIYLKSLNNPLAQPITVCIVMRSPSASRGRKITSQKIMVMGHRLLRNHKYITSSNSRTKLMIFWKSIAIMYFLFRNINKIRK